MESNFITLDEVLQRMDAGERFDLEAVKADTVRGVGGELVVYTNCIKHKSSTASPYQQISKLDKAEKIISKTEVKKNPNHYENSTRNIYLLQKREIRKVHIRLITKFNGRIVL